ncbi:ABC-type multidrug transport system fused ATPase/permease subunit [Deinobacterium chartae]|uniref:ABC-type multidrug transport system fused ATPase/permease subunit n=1 Tax=Deinobacterium chartae TaxID=521158 RepID=A0A841I048_9DEIO|nr:ABC transporter ATP-binding protein [Deinobacterium chartae]MBB6097628.1 ABC-type multidrug transport system fused ATPase/permease subunit [Deinobacterium chartae]
MNSAHSIPLVLRYLRPHRARLILTATALLVATALQLVAPQILRGFIDGAREGWPLAQLLSSAALFLGATVLAQLLSATSAYLGSVIGWTATNELRADLLAHVLHLDMRFHKERTPGELIERIDGDVTALSNLFSQLLVKILGSALLLVGILVLLWHENVWIGLGVTLFAAVAAAVLAHTRDAAVPATRLERETSAQMYGFLEERLAGIDDLRANGGGGYVMRRFTEIQRRFFFAGRRAWWQRANLWVFTMGLFAIGYLITLGLSIHLFVAGSITLGTAYLFFQYVGMLESPIDQLVQQMQELQKARASLARVSELLQERSALPGGTLELPAGPLELSFEDVQFGYGAQPVLSDLNFRLEPGRTLGLLGRTGGGKTTLTRLVQRLHDPTAGTVRLGGLPLTAVRLASLRARVGVVTQDVQIFRASLRDNLTLFDASVADARLEAVLDELGMTDWLRALPEGLNTPLGGGELSAGEAQLIALARVFLGDPGLVILDEFSSRLDPATEARLERAVARLLTGRSAIIIAHRLETVARADDLLVLGDGRMLEFGPRSVLERDPGSHYSALRAAHAAPALEAV